MIINAREVTKRMKKGILTIVMASFLVVTISGNCFFGNSAYAGTQQTNSIAKPTISGTGSIAGTVTNKTGVVLPGVIVSALRIGGGGFYVATTGIDGRYMLSGVAVGQYVLTASKFGYGVAIAGPIWVGAGQTAPGDLSLTGPIIKDYSSQPHPAELLSSVNEPESFANLALI